MLLAFAALFVMAFALMNQKREDNKANVDMKAEYIISMSWPDDLDYDMDLYVEDPLGNLVCFRSRENGLMHLDRDDLGHRHDEVKTPQGDTRYMINKEIVTLRGVLAGEYCVNAHAYFMPDKISPFVVTATVDKINPKAETLLVNKVQINKRGDEKTLMRFTLDAKGNLVANNTMQKKLFKKTD
jgi:hypothetical protein